MAVDRTAIHLLLRQMRKARKWSRGQVGRWLGVSATVIFNMETGRSRIPLTTWFAFLERAGVDWKDLLARYSFSIRKLRRDEPSTIISQYRKRIKMSQKQLANELGYSNASMIHHFEKGLREPSLDDLIALMILAGDNVQGLVKELSNDNTFTALFPMGEQAQYRDWSKYWAMPYIPAVRQLLRTSYFRRLQSIQPETIAATLNINLSQSKHALEVLNSLGLIDRSENKITVNDDVRILIPKNLSTNLIDQYKKYWVDACWHQYSNDTSKSSLCSVDLLPINRKLYDDIIERIRTAQDDVHSLDLTSTDGLVQLVWMGSYVPITDYERGVPE